MQYCRPRMPNTWIAMTPKPGTLFLCQSSISDETPYAKPIDFFRRPNNLDPPLLSGCSAAKGGVFIAGGGPELRRKSARSEVPREGTETASRGSNLFIGTRPLGREEDVLGGMLGAAVAALLEP